MYAIVEIAGQQFKVEKDQQLFVHRLEGKEGSSVDFDNVLLIDNAGKINVGAPAIDGAMVSAKILEHLKGDKVIVFKKKRRKGYKVRNGHRQYLTKIQVENILESGAKKKAAEPAKAEKTTAKAKEAEATATTAKTAEKPAAKKAAPKASAAKTETKAKTETAAKKTTVKKTTATAKKATPKKDGDKK